MARLSDGAERLFWRLTVVADDHGRFDAHPVTVKARCFPVMVDELKTSKVCAWLTELSIDHCLFYSVDGRPYGQFRKWAEYQRTYNQKSKFPEPPATSGESPGNPALILNRESIYENRESRIDISPPPVESGFESFWSAFPRKVGKKEAARAWGRAKDRPPLADILTAIELQKESEQWKKDGGQFIPHPATWLNQGRWADVVKIQTTGMSDPNGFLSGMQAFLERHQ
jgi:hypothetical protein